MDRNLKLGRNGLFTALLLTALYGCGPSKTAVRAGDDQIKATLDLVQVVGDKVQVVVDPGRFSADEVTFFIPKTVPGTYSEDDYGKYIEQFKALDYKGGELAFQKLDNNSWSIANASQLDKVVYWVNDTYDTEREVTDKVFSPAGTNILTGENYMLNLHGFVGYFDGLQEVPYTLRVNVPTGLEAMTSLRKAAVGLQEPGVDVFEASRYFEVIDNPIMYSKPNTEIFQVGDITVSLSVYSPTGAYAASDLKQSMEKMMAGQKRFLGDINSTKNYAIILYLSTMAETDAVGFGALEHHTSTVVVLPEQLPLAALEENMIDIVSHEFFHIVTPLTVHSEEIQYFDFNHPKMSRHLWMYEGTTEYFANLFQVQQGLIEEDVFYTRLLDKVENAKNYDDTMSFTALSKNVFDSPYKENYINVYEKGALINMALDLELREWSQGEKGVLWLMKELSKKYGDNKPFEDDKLFEVMADLSFPGVLSFLEAHVAGGIPIDYNAYWNKVGLTVEETQVGSGYFFHDEMPFIDVDPGQENVVFVRKGIVLNSFFTDLGVQGGDVLQEINGTAINLESMRSVIMASFAWMPDQDVTIKIKRGEEEMTISGKAGAPTLRMDRLVPVTGISAAQETLRNSWLKG